MASRGSDKVLPARGKMGPKRLQVAVQSAIPTGHDGNWKSCSVHSAVEIDLLELSYEDRVHDCFWGRVSAIRQYLDHKLAIESPRFHIVRPRDPKMHLDYQILATRCLGMCFGQ